MRTVARSRLRWLGILALLLPLAGAILPAAVAHADEGKNESGKHGDKEHKSKDRKEEHGSGRHDCCSRVHELEEEIHRLRDQLKHCHGDRDCSADHPCPTADFPCKPKPGHCDRDCPRDHPCPTRDSPCKPRPGHHCDPDPDHGCVRSQGYWKNHQPWPTEGRLCGRGWNEILSSEPGGDAWLILAHQWIAAKLNQAAGAEVPPDVERALREAERLLSRCSIAPADRQRALEIKDILDRYNNGRAGPEKCH